MCRNPAAGSVGAPIPAPACRGIAVAMARDIFIKLNRCTYCGKPGFTVWDEDIFSCGREVCRSLAFSEVRRRNRNGGEAPEKRLTHALLSALDTFEYELGRDEDAELVEPDEAHRIDAREREQTARLIGRIHELERSCSGQSSGRRTTRLSRPSRRA